MPRHDNFISPEASFHIRSRGRLPHWELDDAIYSITTRLADAIPANVLNELREQRERAIAKADTAAERRAIDRMFEVRLDYFAGQGHGECWLARPAAAEIMRGALWYFERKRYVLHAYAIMPNHVHVLLCLFRGADLERTLHSWKSYTANEINRVVGRRGNLWEREYYDRIARDIDEYEWTLNYIVENPAKAGLHDWPWVWKRE